MSVDARDRDVTIVRNANLALRFVLELSAVAAAGYWGWRTGDGATRSLLALTAAGAVIAVWWLFVSPKAKVDLWRPLVLVVEFGVWAAAAAAVAATDHVALALAFFLVATVSGTLNYVWK